MPKLVKLLIATLRACWRSLMLVSGGLGLLYFWPDIRDLPVAYGLAWGQLMPDRETVAFVLLGFAAAWIVWIDLRPLAFSWWKTRGGPLQISFPNEINSPSKSGPNKLVVTYLPTEEGNAVTFSTQFRIGVKNASNDKTVRNVRVVVQYISTPGSIPNVMLPCVDNEQNAMRDIAPGETAYFVLGEGKGGIVGDRMVMADAATLRLLHERFKNFGFILTHCGNDKNIALRKNDNYKVIIGIYGDDAAPRFEEFQINAKNVSVYYVGPSREFV